MNKVLRETFPIRTAQLSPARYQTPGLTASWPFLQWQTNWHCWHQKYDYEYVRLLSVTINDVGGSQWSTSVTITEVGGRQRSISVTITEVGGRQWSMLVAITEACQWRSLKHVRGDHWSGWQTAEHTRCRKCGSMSRHNHRPIVSCVSGLLANQRFYTLDLCILFLLP